jgi:galactose mutarotase-like enzyme
MDYASNRALGCRILEYSHRGLTHLCLENDIIRVTIILDKGSDITEILYKPKDINLMWQAPGGGVRETGKMIPNTNSKMGNNLDYYEGGWHESFPGGGPYQSNGMEQGLHGEACLIPWQFCVINDTKEETTVMLWCETIRFPARIEKTITIKTGSGVINFTEELINLSNEDLEYMWGHHPVFGEPFLDSNCVIDIEAESFTTATGFNSPVSFFKEGYTGCWPSDTGKDSKLYDLSVMPANDEANAELIFISPLGEGKYTIKNEKMGLTFSVCWDKDIFDCIWYWRVLRGLPGYPWYGRTYNIGLEFWSGYPNFTGARANKTIKILSGGNRIKTKFTACIAKSNEI